MSRFTIFLVAACALSACATDQNRAPHPAQDATSAQPVNPACPGLKRWTARQLYGAWEVELTDLGLRGRLVLRQHPEFLESLRGEFDYGGQQAIASGDIEEGELNLDESRDGKSLFAFWSGHLMPAACGKEIRGTWEQVPRAGEPGRKSPFVLRRAASGSHW